MMPLVRTLGGAAGGGIGRRAAAADALLTVLRGPGSPHCPHTQSLRPMQGL
jgi:hypothetical protein